MSWRRSDRPKVKPPRFDVVQKRTVVIDDPTDLDAEDELWQQRGAYWEAIADAGRAHQRSDTLTIAGHGALLRIDGNALVVRNGFTHYPQERCELRFVPRDRALPERIVILSHSGALTIAALEWLARERVPLVFLDQRGNVASTFSAAVGDEIDLTLRNKLQSIDSKTALDVAKTIIAGKLLQHTHTIKQLPVAIALRMSTIDYIRREQEALARATSIDDVRLAEARAAVAYFRPWVRLPLRWKGLNSRPVPAEWHSVGARGSIIGRANRNSTHPANSMLNYSYAVLQSQVTVACAQAGLDSMAGIIHTRRPGRPALVLDLMEPLRPLVDAKVVEFLRSHVFARADFPIGSDGVVRLHPQLARGVANVRLDATLVQKTMEEFKANVRSA